MLKLMVTIISQKELVPNKSYMVKLKLIPKSFYMKIVAVIQLRILNINIY